MSVRNLDKIFKPRRVALLGTSGESASLGLSVLSNLLGAGYQGVVYVIDPERESIRGVPTYPDLSSVPRVPDLAVICSPAEAVPDLVRSCGDAGIRGIAILSGGFRESGAAGKALEARIKAVAAGFDHMRIIGPNSLGIIGPGFGLNASHAVTLPKPGRLAFISESRALCNSVMDWAAEEGIGFSYFVSIGNMLDVSFGDLIDYFGNDPDTRAIILYVQSLENVRGFMSAARAFARAKPIVAYKAGRFAESAQVAASHTGAMVVEDAVYAAAFERAGVVRVTELDDIFDVADLLASQRLPKGRRLAIITNAGGPAIIATDALLSRGGALATLDPETEVRLGEVLPPVGQHSNPVDLLDGAPPERFAQSLPLVLEDKGVDAALVIFATQSGSDPCATAHMVVEAARRARKPVLAAWMGGGRVREGIRILNAAGIPTHATPEQAVRAFMHLVSYARNLVSLYETPREIPVSFTLNRHKLRKRLSPILQGKPSECLSESQAKAFLKAYEIPVCDSCMAQTPDEAVAVAERMGYPVVLKVSSPRIIHKVDMGGVSLDLKSAEEVRGAYQRMLDAARSRRLEDQIHGFTVQRMMNVKHGLELILGAKKDPTFGAVIMVGMGGVATGLYRDSALGFPPLNERLARRMLESLRFWPILQGYRGEPAVNLDRLIEVMIRFSLLIADYPEIKEFDINPLLVTADGVVALDAAMILDDQLLPLSADPYPHLAIRPYPEEYIRHLVLADGTRITLRSVRAEDEPLWHRLIARSSPESIRFRFRSLFRQATHRMAVEHCGIDYERAISIVAETQVDGQRELVGVAQLIADANHESAEYGVLVPDPWQGRKLGGMLLDYCLELAAGWGVQRVVAETDPDNVRMLEAFHKRGFQAEIRREEEVVVLERSVAVGSH